MKRTIWAAVSLLCLLAFGQPSRVAAADFTVIGRYLNSSSVPYGGPTGPNQTFYVAFYIRRDTGVTNISSYSMNLYMDTSSCSYTTASGDLSLNGGQSYVVGVWNDKDATHQDGHPRTTKWARVAGAWLYDNPCLNFNDFPNPGDEDGMIKVRFRTTAAPVLPLKFSILPDPDSSAPVEYVSVSMPWETGPASIVVDDSSVPVGISGFTID